MSTRRKAAFFNVNPAMIDRVWGLGRRERIAELTDMYPHLVGRADFDAHATALADIECIFSTWGMWAPDEAQLDRLPQLKAVFYAAGSVQAFARPFLARGITVMSAWHANAAPVAEYALAQILLANKGYWPNMRASATHEGRAAGPFSGRGNFGATVAVLGAGAVGSRLIALLRPFALNIIVFDPFLPDERAAEWGVEKVSLADAFARADVVTNHLANLPQTVGMLQGEHFAAMPDHATFINTGRGATVNEPDLIAELSRRPTLTALLDVTAPEPPTPDSPLYALDNVYLTSHIAGSLGDEVVRQADFAIAEFERYDRGEPLKYAVTLKMLETMA